MRTQGNFSEIYHDAKAYYTGNDENIDSRPMDPVVRYVGNGMWYLESGLNSEENTIAECPLDTFDSFFYETYQDDYEPTEDDEQEFLKMIRDND